jgi:hypothetical protein
MRGLPSMERNNMIRIAHRPLLVLAVLLLAAAGSAQAQWGSFRGRFVYEGTPPQPEKINVTKDTDVCGKHHLVDESLLVGPDGGIKNVVVWVMSKNVKINPEYDKLIGKVVTFDNKGCRFEPHVLPVWWKKEVIDIHNSDPIGHNSNMQPLGDEGINPLLPPNGEAKYQFQANRPPFAPVSVTCNIHPWMKGWIVARDNPYTAVSKADGTFEIKDLPVGELEFRAWQEKSGYITYGDWSKGKFKFDIKEGDNDLGTIKLSGDQFNK